MKILHPFLCSRLSIVLFMIAAICVFKPSAVLGQNQNSGAEIDECSSDNWMSGPDGDPIEWSACLTGDSSGIVGSEDLMLWGDSGYTAAVSSRVQLYDKSTLVADSGDDGSYAYVAQVNIGDLYTLIPYWQYCYDPSGGGGSCSWSGDMPLNSVSATVTGPPSILYPAYKITSIVYPAPGNRSNDGFTNSTTDGATTTVGSSLSTSTSTSYSFGGGIPGFHATLNLTFGVASTTGNSRTDTETYTDAGGVTLANNSAAPDAIDHTQDLFLIWLNPAISIAPTGPATATYTVGTQTDSSGAEEEVDQVEVTARTMIGTNGVSSVEPYILKHQRDANGNPLPGLASICANLNAAEYAADACTLTDQCGCTASDFQPIIAQDPLLNYNNTVGSPYPTTVSPLNADTDGAACADPTSSSNCRYIPVPASPGSNQQMEVLLSGPQCSGCSYPTNPISLSDTTTTTRTLSEDQSYSVGYSWKVNVLGLTFNGPTTQYTWKDSESSGKINGYANTQAGTLSSATVGCYEDDVTVFEDTRFHTFVFQQPANNNSCP
jgi:hypothetical protein